MTTTAGSGSLELLGHYNPFHEYPSPVIPILRTEEGELFAAYYSGGTLSLRSLEDHFSVNPVVGELALQARDYDARHWALFAFAEDNVIRYPRDNEAWCLRGILGRAELLGANPFIKLSIAKKAGLTAESATHLVRCCALELGPLNGNDFTAAWYANTRAALDVELPPEVATLFADADVGTVASLRSDRNLLLCLSRSANDQVLDHSLVCPLVKDWLPSADDYAGIDAILREMDSVEEDSESIPFASSEILLAVRRAYVEEHDLSLSWESVLGEAASDESFRWVRPRAETATGRWIEWALNDLFGSGRTSATSKLEQRNLAARVSRHARFDEDAAQIAINWDRWAVDAMVVKRHCARQLLGHLAGMDRALLIPYREPIFVDYAIKITRGGMRANRRDYFERLRSSNSVQTQLRTLGAKPPRSVAAVARLDALSVKGVGERPVAVCLVVDVSRSMAGEKLEAAKQGIAALLGFLSADRNDIVGMVTFSDRATRSVPMARIDQAGESVAASLRRLNVQGNTALLDAILLACEEVEKWTEFVGAIVVVTDGHENRSRSTLSVLEAHLARMSVIPAILSLAYGDDADYGLLRRLADKTRGTVLKGTVLNIVHLYHHLATIL